MKITLSDEQKATLEQQHKTERDSRVCDRIKAVLLSAEGWSQKRISQALRIHPTTVWVHLNDYLNEEKLKPCSGGSSSKLNEAETEALIAHLENNTYPSTKEIIQHVQDNYGVSYSQQGMHDWLWHHKFSYKKPKGTPAKFKQALQESFIAYYAQLKASLSSEEMLFFMDSVHPTQETKITYGWIRTGVEKLIATVASRKRINITGAIELESMSLTSKEYETIDGRATVDFLKSLEADYPNASKIHIIADGGGAHTSHEVQLFLCQPNATNRHCLEEKYGIKLPPNTVILTKKMKADLELVMKKEPLWFENHAILKEEKITACRLLVSLKAPPPHPKLVMHILPPYSPNLNPIERVWKVMNEHVRNNKVFDSFSEFKTAISRFFSTTWGSISSSLPSRINDNFQRLKPVF